MSVFRVFLVSIWFHLTKYGDYSVNFRIQSKREKIWIRKTPNTNTFLHSEHLTFTGSGCWKICRWSRTLLINFPCINSGSWHPLNAMMTIHFLFYVIIIICFVKSLFTHSLNTGNFFENDSSKLKKIAIFSFALWDEPG